MTSQVPFVPPPADQPVVETKTPMEEEAEESSRFQAAKTKALQDKHVQDLQATADSATGDDANRRRAPLLPGALREDAARSTPPSRIASTARKPRR